MGRSLYTITELKAPHFVTCTVLHWILVFTRPDTVNILFSSLCFMQAVGLGIPMRERGNEDGVGKLSARRSHVLRGYVDSVLDYKASASSS